MTDDQITLAEIAEQEGELRLPALGNDDAWALGVTLVDLARAQKMPVTIHITRGKHELFHAALAGASTEHDSWIARKTRVVERFGHSSLYVGQECREQGTTYEQRYGLEDSLYAAHGGAFPLVVRGQGPVGVIVVSGLPQLDDHRLVVAGLRAHLDARATMSS